MTHATMSPRTALLTGASSGIGAALTTELVTRGWDLGLMARRVESMETLRRDLLQRYPGRRIEVRALDVTDTTAVQRVLPELMHALGGASLVIANAGIGGGKAAGTGRFAADEAIIRTNLIGAMATVDTAIPLLQAQGGGHIVGISSVAAFRGLPGGGAYSASKAGLDVYLEAVRAEVAPLGIDVSTISPGFIDTPINQQRASRPFVITAEDGARQIADLIERRVRHSTIPVFPWGAVGTLMRVLPDAIWYRVVGRAVPPRG